MVQTIGCFTDSTARVMNCPGPQHNLCIKFSGLVQAIKIKSIEKTKGMLRLRFIAGGRVFAAMGRYLAEEAALNKVLVSPASRVPARVYCICTVQDWFTEPEYA